MNIRPETGKSDRAKQIAVLDKLCSEYVRRRAIAEHKGCERCSAPKLDVIKDNGEIFPAWKQLDWAHLFPRVKLGIRWEPDAAVGLCGGCHFYIDSHPVEKIEFAKKILGVRYQILEARAQYVGSKVDLQLTGMLLRNLLITIKETR